MIRVTLSVFSISAVVFTIVLYVHANMHENLTPRYVFSFFVDMVSCSFTNNVASSGSGGAIYCSECHTLMVSNSCTFEVSQPWLDVATVLLSATIVPLSSFPAR
mgnify:CR=1 FL=1